jgi:hypothetical protein
MRGISPWIVAIDEEHFASGESGANATEKDVAGARHASD